MANRHIGKSPDSLNVKAQTTISKNSHDLLKSVASRRGLTTSQYIRRSLATQLAIDIEERKSQDQRSPQLTTIMQQMASMDSRSNNV